MGKKGIFKNRTTRLIIYGLLSILMLVFVTTSTTYAWFLSYKRMSEITIDSGDLSVTSATNLYRYTYPYQEGTTDVAYALDGSVSKIANIDSTTSMLMNRYDPIMVLIENNITASDLYTNFLYEFNVSITSDVRFKLEVEAIRSELNLTENQLLISKYLIFNPVSEANIESQTLDVTPTGDNAVNTTLFLKAKQYSELLTTTKYRFRTNNTFATNLTVFEDSTIYNSTDTSNTTTNLKFYLNIDYYGDYLTEYVYSLVETIQMVADFRLLIKTTQEIPA